MKFQETKKWFIDTIEHILTLLESINTSIKGCDITNLSLKAFYENISNLNCDDVINNLNINLNMIKRNKMKCVVFGKTSNGKSAIINRILGNKVLPSSYGRTTSCFISVEGCDENNGYLLDKNKKQYPLEAIETLANEFDDSRFGVDSLLNLFWPKSKCPLLKNDLEIIDSPGVDVSKDSDDWIKKYCEDADVFLLVVDGQSTLNESEKALFIKIKEIMKPNIFVLVNKWDSVCDNSDENNINRIKKQHLDTISCFLIQELGLYNSNNVSDQIYFVSATKENASFNNFLEHFCNEISKNAIEIKFRPHFDKIREILIEINDFTIDYFDNVGKENNMDDEKIEHFRTSVISLVTQCFLKISKDTESLIKKNVTKIVFSLQNAVEKKVELDQLAVNFLEVEFGEIISHCFKTNLDDLEDLLTMKFLENSSSKKSSIEEMQNYFTNTNNLKDLSNQYKECISLNLKNVATNVRSSFNTKENRITIYNNILKSLRISSKALVLPAFLIKKVVWPAALALTGLSIIGEFIPQTTNDDIPKEMLNAFTENYLNLSKCFIGEFHSEVIRVVEQLIIDFVIHQKQIYERFEEFEIIQTQCIMLLNDVSGKDDDLTIPSLSCNY